MWCKDFIFDKERLSDYGMMLCSFNEDGDSIWSGGDVTFQTGKTPSASSWKYYNSTYEQPLECQVSICKADHGEAAAHPWLSREEYSSIMRWLKRRDGYYWLQFDQDDCEDIYYRAQIKPQPVFIGGCPAGFHLTITTDSPYGYSHLMKTSFSLEEENPKIFIKNYSDTIGHIYPKITIIPKEDGSIVLNSGIAENTRQTVISGCAKNQTIVLDGEYDIFSGIEPSDFNFVFPVLSNSQEDINSYFELGTHGNTSSIGFDAVIEYRFPKEVCV